jgi:hypothetical protein
MRESLWEWDDLVIGMVYDISEAPDLPHCWILNVIFCVVYACLKSSASLTE